MQTYVQVRKPVGFMGVYCTMTVEAFRADATFAEVLGCLDPFSRTVDP